ncbi:hypothetical protein [Chitinophaga barathri]|uniref:Uncharacterized protein n=1 Tax=Chitinophaga barathri TaxID=1647451 RepID=A0A3N4MAJ7_9BACT|nr:hypothetical protein [Chitinophaga barathri]RPD38417.1 hypothetical protein EG028_24410 [Chitinophaga barathri]
MKYLSRPDIQLLIIAAIVVILGQLQVANSAIDIHLHDTYFVIALSHLAWAYAIFLVMEAGLYTTTSWFRQWRWLQIFHIFSLVLLPLTFIVMSGYHYEPEPGMPRRYFDYNNYSELAVMRLQFLPWFVTASLLIFLAGQIGFVVNIVAGFFRGRNH